MQGKVFGRQSVLKQEHRRLNSWERSVYYEIKQCYIFYCLPLLVHWNIEPPGNCTSCRPSKAAALAWPAPDSIPAEPPVN